MGMLSRVVLALTFGSLIFIGVPLLGWGPGDLNGFFEDGVRAAYVALVIVLNILVALFLPTAGRKGEMGKNPVARQKWALILLQVIPLVMLIVAPYCDRRDIAMMPDFLSYPGLLSFGVGFLLFSLSEVVLGKQFSLQITIQEDHQLVTQGLYNVLRHPRYAGMLLTNLGVVLVFHSWLGLLLFAALGAVLLWRIGDEEALLREEFGAEWDAYANKSWRLIPYIY